MILNELARENTLLLVTAKDLMEFGRQLISQAKLVVEMEQQKEELLTVQEVCDELHRTAATLRRWKHAGYLEPVHVGGSPMYRRSDIEKLKGK